MSASAITVEVAAGELLDKITILEIKEAKFTDATKLANVRAELETLRAARDANLPSTPEIERAVDGLREVNRQLWEIEDEIREHERQKDFGERFVELARAVYKTNDRRAELKREINDLTGSRLKEEKSYAAY
jgi:predicted  nucleic acid-binding Zn-ribbon protein